MLRYTSLSCCTQRVGFLQHLADSADGVFHTQGVIPRRQINQARILPVPQHKILPFGAVGEGHAFKFLERNLAVYVDLPAGVLSLPVVLPGAHTYLIKSSRLHMEIPIRSTDRHISQLFPPMGVEQGLVIVGRGCDGAGTVIQRIQSIVAFIPSAFRLEIDVALMLFVRLAVLADVVGVIRQIIRRDKGNGFDGHGFPGHHDLQGVFPCLQLNRREFVLQAPAHGIGVEDARLLLGGTTLIAGAVHNGIARRWSRHA